MERKGSAYDIRDPSRAPEVAPSYAPVPAYRESEGLQVGYDYTEASGKEAVAHDRSLSQDEKAAQYAEPSVARGTRPWYRRKRWIAAIVLLILVIFAAAVGSAVGATSGGDGGDGQAAEGQTAGEEQANDQPGGEANASAAATATGNSSPSSTTSSVATSGTSGIAEFSCNNGSYVYSAQPAGLAYVEHCNTMYAYNSPSIFSEPDGLIEGLFSSTKYSFQDCVDSCDTWNTDNPQADAPCRSVSYYANLTNVFTLHEDWHGNCILKSGVGGVTTNKTSDSTADWAHTASAYRACLEEGTPCSSSSSSSR